ncbi:hypothetical protein KC685_01285 [Candidatus Dojkabacteria bacterium]|uniref:Uncharacterized protein n=2 Tax=Bacteria candidate phyla TaxID=1783234 RepID=A0A955I1D3_9BACT|nr:hypothetical protein [Candidatus Dojkabacteria bacterium]
MVINYIVIPMFLNRENQPVVTYEEHVSAIVDGLMRETEQKGPIYLVPQLPHMDLFTVIGRHADPNTFCATVRYDQDRPPDEDIGQISVDIVPPNSNGMQYEQILVVMDQFPDLTPEVSKTFWNAYVSSIERAMNASSVPITTIVVTDLNRVTTRIGSYEAKRRMRREPLPVRPYDQIEDVLKRDYPEYSIKMAYLATGGNEVLMRRLLDNPGEKEDLLIEYLELLIPESLREELQLLGLNYLDLAVVYGSGSAYLETLMTRGADIDIFRVQQILQSYGFVANLRAPLLPEVQMPLLAQLPSERAERLVEARIESLQQIGMQFPENTFKTLEEMIFLYFVAAVKELNVKYLVLQTITSEIERLGIHMYFMPNIINDIPQMGVMRDTLLRELKELIKSDN